MKNGKYPEKWAKKSAALPREWQSGGGKAAQRRTKESAVPQNADKTKLLCAGAGFAGLAVLPGLDHMGQPLQRLGQVAVKGGEVG